MPGGVQNASARRLLEDQGDAIERLVDLRTQWVDWSGGKLLVDAGGVWDRRLEQYIGDGETAQVVKFQPAQYPAVKWFHGWLAAYLAGGERPDEYDRRWTMFCVGGRRGGKSDFAAKAAAAFAASSPGRKIFLISPTERETEELKDVLDLTIPPHWCHFSDSKLIYTMANLSTLQLLSGFKPSSLRRGRVDFWVLNEAQSISKSAYTHLRAPLADTGGLGLVVANPPDRPIGRWIMDLYDECKAGKRTAVMFEFDPELNPAIDHRALEDMKDDVGEKDYRRDVLGEMIEIGDLVWYAFSSKYNVKPEPEIGEITREFTRQNLGREFDHVFGIDLQLTPHMAAAGARFFRNPDDPLDAFCWFTDEVVIEGDEDDLIDELELKGYDPARTALIVDASAWWQDAARTKGRGSVDMFRKRGWKFCYRPDAKSTKNPPIFERCQATNARFKTASGIRRAFVSPNCRQLVEACRRWENRNGAPYRRSPYAHRSDAISYLINRFWPRRLKTRGLEITRIQRSRSKRERDLDKL